MPLVLCSVSSVLCCVLQVSFFVLFVLCCVFCLVFCFLFMLCFARMGHRSIVTFYWNIHIEKMLNGSFQGKSSYNFCLYIFRFFIRNHSPIKMTIWHSLDMVKTLVSCTSCVNSNVKYGRR